MITLLMLDQTHRNINGEVVDKPKQIGTELNDYFVNVGPNTQKIVPKVPNISSAYFLKNRNQFNCTYLLKVLEIIKSLPTSILGLFYML